MHLRHSQFLALSAACALTVFVAGCDHHDHSSTAPSTGVIAGTVTSSLGGALDSVSLVVAPSGGQAMTAVMSSSTGAFRVADVPSSTGKGSIAVSNVPVNCAAPSPVGYTGLEGGDSVVVPIVVTCTPLTGTVSGTVTSSLGGGIASATVTITPTGKSALPAVQTSGTGTYSKTVPVGAGTVAVTSVPGNCTNPAAAPYSSLASGGTVTVNVTVTCTPLTGGMTITVTAPIGVTPSISVTGPAGYSRAVSATQTLTTLTPGSYTVTAATFRATGGIVTVVDTGIVTGSPSTVTAGATAAVTVAYSAEGPAGLWLANITGSEELTQFVGTQLTASGSPTPTGVINGSPEDSPALAFDHNGNLWITDQGANRLREYTASQLSDSTATPTATISSDFGGTTGLAFDASGNLWIANYGPCEIDEYTAAQLAAATGTATITPALIVDHNCSQASLSGPHALAFDASGNLWVVDIDYERISEFSAASLAGTGTINIDPTVELRTTDNLQGGYVAFDAAGNLWESSHSTRVVEYSTSQLGATATVTPAVTITTTSASFEGLAFDNSGNLWAVDYANKAVDQFTTSQLTGGAISPTVAINAANGSANNAPWTLAFYLHSSSLPLYNRAPRHRVAQK